MFLKFSFCPGAPSLLNGVAPIFGTREAFYLFLGFGPSLRSVQQTSKECKRNIPGAVDTRVASDEHRIRDFCWLFPRHWTPLNCTQIRGRMKRQCSCFSSGHGAENPSRLSCASIVAMAYDTLRGDVCSSTTHFLLTQHNYTILI